VIAEIKGRMKRDRTTAKRKREEVGRNTSLKRPPWRALEWKKVGSHYFPSSLSREKRGIRRFREGERIEKVWRKTIV